MSSTLPQELATGAAQVRAGDLYATAPFAEPDAPQGRRGRDRQVDTKLAPELRLITDPRVFHDMEAQWEAFLLGSNAISPFMTQGWLGPWMAMFGRGYELHVAAVMVGDRLVAAAPLMIGTERRGLWRGPVVRFVGTGPGLRGNYFCFPMLPDAPPAATELLRDHLFALHAGGHALHLEQLSPFADGHRTMDLLFGDSHRRFSVRTEFPCIHGTLPKTFAEFIAQVPNAARRNRLRRGAAPLMDACDGIEFGECHDEELLDDYLATVARFSVARRSLEGRLSTWASPRNMACRRPAFAHFLQRGMLRFDRLCHRGEPIAAMVGIVHKQAYFCYNMGFDQAYAQHQPGHVLLWRRLRACIEEGLTEFNFLVGEAEYKRQYSRHSSPELTLSCPTPGPGTRLLCKLKGRRRAEHTGETPGRARHAR